VPNGPLIAKDALDGFTRQSKKLPAFLRESRAPKTAEIRANIPNQKSITAVRVAGAASILARARRLTGLRFR
jgi:hypothetical protein